MVTQREFEKLESTVNDIAADVKSLLRFKWQIMGGAGMIGAIAAYLAAISGFLK